MCNIVKLPSSPRTLHYSLHLVVRKDKIQEKKIKHMNGLPTFFSRQVERAIIVPFELDDADVNV